MEGPSSLRNVYAALTFQVSGWSLANSVSVFVALVAFLGVGLGVLQKYLNDWGEQWGKRAQWALEQLQTDEIERRVIPVHTISYLIDSKLARKEEHEYFLTIAAEVSGVI